MELPGSNLVQFGSETVTLKGALKVTAGYAIAIGVVVGGFYLFSKYEDRKYGFDGK